MRLVSRRAVGTAELVAAATAAAVATALWAMSDRFVVVFDHRWIAPLCGAISTVGLGHCATVRQPLHQTWARRLLGTLTALAALATGLFTLSWLVFALLGNDISRTTIPTTVGVDIVHVVAQQGISPNACQYIDMRRGSGLFERHRVATTCTEADGPRWKIEIDGSDITLVTEYRTKGAVERAACAYTIDKHVLALRPIHATPNCTRILT